MNQTNYLAHNLRMYQKMRNLTLKEFSKELSIPRTTLYSVLNEGNTTIDTAIRISNSMNAPLDLLICDEHFSSKLFILEHTEKCGQWLYSLPNEKRTEIADLLARIWNIISK